MENGLAILPYCALLAPSLPMVVGLGRLPRMQEGQRWLLGLLAFYLVNQGAGAWLAAKGISNLPLFHLHVLVEFCVLSTIFLVDGASLLSRKVHISLTILFSLACMLNAAWGDGPWCAPAGMLVTESLLLIALVAAYFLKTFREMAVKRLEQESMFWVSLGILVFFAGTLLISFAVNYILMLEDAVFYEVFLIRAALILLTNICYTIAMLCKTAR